MQDDLLQTELNALLCGEHIWANHPNEVIVGFELVEKIWEGKPTRDGTDIPASPQLKFSERGEVTWPKCTTGTALNVGLRGACESLPRLTFVRSAVFCWRAIASRPR